MTTYIHAGTIEEAVSALAAGATAIAGGTDLVVAARSGKQSLPGHLVGIHRIPDLAEIQDSPEGLRVGALVTHATIAEHPGVIDRFTGLADASTIVGSHATRANGTIGGNVMNASPAMDTGAPLLCHGASVVLVSSNGSRTVDLSDLWSGPGETTAGRDELLTALTIPAPRPDTGSAYVRLQYRRQMEIAIAGVAAVVSVSDGQVTHAALAISALSPVIRRVPEAEAALVEASDSGGVAESARLLAEATAPISDVRASATYRVSMAAVMARRAIGAAMARASGAYVAIPASDSTFGSSP